MKRKIVVFGDGVVDETSEQWKIAENTGSVLATEGIAVVNGGYGGVMAAASKGAKENGGAAHGIVHLPFEVKQPNPFLTEIEEVSDYGERLAALMRYPVAIGLPGATGTVAEITASIALIVRFPERHLALWEPFWAEIMNPLYSSLDVKLNSRVQFVSSMDDIRKWVRSIVRV